MSEGVIVTLISVSIPLFILFFTYRVMRKSGAWSIMTGQARRARRRLMANGRQAQARIVDLGESGRKWMTTINDNPVVRLHIEVHDGHRPPYRTTVTQLVSRLDVPQFQPGGWIPVLVDPNNPDNVVIGTKETGPQVVGNTEQPDIQYGHQGSVTIKGIRVANYQKNGAQVYALEYDVQSPQHGSYTLTKDIPLPPQAIDKLRINGTYSAQIDDYERDRVVINVR